MLAADRRAVDRSVWSQYNLGKRIAKRTFRWYNNPTEEE